MMDPAFMLFAMEMEGELPTRIGKCIELYQQNYSFDEISKFTGIELTAEEKQYVRMACGE